MSIKSLADFELSGSGGGLRYASGNNMSTNDDVYHKLTVSGLGFRPKFVTAQMNSDVSNIYLKQGFNWNGWLSFGATIQWNTTSSQGGGADQFQVTNDGFTIILREWNNGGSLGDTDVDWEAWG